MSIITISRTSDYHDFFKKHVLCVFVSDGLTCETCLFCFVFSSPKDFALQDRTGELSEKVSSLELQLEIEIQQKNEAMTNIEKLASRLAELEQQLLTEAQQRRDDAGEETAEQRVADLELQLQSECQQKLEAVESLKMLEIRVADLEKQLKEEGHAVGETDEQVCCVYMHL